MNPNSQNTLNCEMLAINDLGVYCRIIVLVVGALGFVDGQLVNSLKIVGLG